jgi:hypothetical protein
MDNQPTHVFTPEDDLIEVVSEALRTQGHPLPREWHRHLRLVDEVRHDQNLMRRTVNRALRMYIAAFPIDTIAVRTCIVDDGSLNDWFGYLNRAVFPCMIEQAKTPPSA